MAKRIDNTVAFSADETGKIIIADYTPSFTEDERKNIRVHDAVMKVQLAQVQSGENNGVGLNIYVQRGENDEELIEQIPEPNSDKMIAVKIGDELQQALTLKQQSLRLKFDFTGSDMTIGNYSSCEVIVEYDNRKSRKTEASLEFDAGRAGVGIADLNSGGLTFSHGLLNVENLAIPLSLGQSFSSERKGMDADDVLYKDGVKALPSFNCGKGWKLNAQQYLVKEKEDDTIGKDKETSAVFTYLDGGGIHTPFYEKYYYNNVQKKRQYIKFTDVEIGADGELSYTDSESKKYDIEKEILSDSGLTLQNEPEGFKGLNLLDKDVEEVARLKEQIEQLKTSIEEIDHTCDNIKKNIQTYVISVNTNSVRYNLQNSSLKYAQAQLWLQEQQKDNTISVNENNYLASQVSQNANEKLAGESAYYIAEANRVATYGGNGHDSRYETFVQYQSDINSYTDSVLNGCPELDSLRTALLEYMNASEANEFMNMFDEQIWRTRSQNETMQIVLQLFNLLYENKRLGKNRSDCEEQLVKLNRKLREITLQIPVHIITDGKGTMLGFAPTELEDVYRLILISDGYENAVFYEYKEDKLVRITDAEERSVTLEYGNSDGDGINGLLKSIISASGQAVRLDYADGLLREAFYADGTSSVYDYDESGNLKKAVSPDGYGYLFVYENNRVMSATEIAFYAAIDKNASPDSESRKSETFTSGGGTEFTYRNGRTVAVKDIKSGKVTTYIFNDSGQPVTVYEAKNEQDLQLKNVYVNAFDYVNAKRAFKIQPLMNCENLLDGGTVTEYSENPLYENYLGQSLCEAGGLNLAVSERKAKDAPADGVYSLEERTNSVNMIERVITEQTLARMIESGATDFILSGWAKANSAYTEKRATDYCDDQKYHADGRESDIDKIMAECAYEAQSLRHFELRAELEYRKPNGKTYTEKQFASYDYRNTDWQYCSLPVTFKDNTEDTLTQLRVYFDYSYNTYGAEFYGMELRESKWEYSEYNERGQLAYSENSLSPYITVYEYNEESQRPTCERMIDKQGEERIRTYEYNTAGSPVRTTDFDGTVSETVYDVKGNIVRQLTYHKDEPQSRFYSEAVLDEKGKTVGEVNEFGEKTSEYEYNDNSGRATGIKNVGGGTTAYGYDGSGNVVGIAADDNGEVNGNTVKYVMGHAVSAEHNGTEYAFSYDGFGRETSVTIGGSRYCETVHTDSETKTLYENGEAVTSLNGPDGKQTEVRYTDMNGTTKTVLQNFYDSYGNLNCVRDNSGQEEVSYNTYSDKYGNCIRRDYALGGNAVSVDFEYDKYGKVLSDTVTVGSESRRTEYAYSGGFNDRLTCLTLPNTLTQKLFYDRQGRIQAVTTGDYYKEYSYMQKGDHASNLLVSERFGKSCVTGERMRYVYDVNGNLTEVKEGGKTNVFYVYDGVNRLVREDNRKLGQTATYEYDSGGNLLARTEYAFTRVGNDLLEGGTAYEYAYRAEGWRDQLLSYNGESFDYDEVGNPKVYRGKTLAWSHVRQLDRFGENTSYTYNVQGIRTSKTVSGVTTKFHCDGARLLAQELSDGQALYFTYGAEGVAGFTLQGEGEYLYKKNAMGDILAIIDQSGTEIVRYVYNAWGNHKIFVLNSGNYIDIFSQTVYDVDGEINRRIADLNPIRYRGYYFDVETGLYYLQSRYYDPELGRFINADNISFLDPETINGLNLYAYCLNNPIGYSDETGCSILLTLLIGFLIGAAVGFVSSVTTQAFTYGWSEINWGVVALDTIIGGIGGAISVSPLGILGQMAFGGLLSMGGYVGTQLIRGEEMTNSEIFLSFAMGAIFSADDGALFGKMAGKKIAKTSFVTQIEKDTMQTIRKKGIISGLKHYRKHIGQKILKDYAISSVRIGAIIAGINTLKFWGQKVLSYIGFN